MEYKVCLLTYLKNYSLGRSQYVDLDHTTSDINEVHCGIPEGSVIGLLRLNICINDTVEASSLFDLIMYADDTTLVSTLEIFGHRIYIYIYILIQKYQKIATWLKSNMLELNVEKFKFNIFFKHPKNY